MNNSKQYFRQGLNPFILLLTLIFMLSACGSGDEKEKASNSIAGGSLGIIDLWANDRQQIENDNSVTATLSSETSADNLADAHLTLSYSRVSALEPHLCYGDKLENGVWTLSDDDSANLDGQGYLNGFTLHFKGDYDFNYSEDENRTRLSKWVNKVFNIDRSGNYQNNIVDYISGDSRCGDDDWFEINLNNEMYVLGQDFVLPAGTIVDDLGRQNPRMTIRFELLDENEGGSPAEITYLETNEGLSTKASMVINGIPKDGKLEARKPTDFQLVVNQVPTMETGIRFATQTSFSLLFSTNIFNPPNTLWADEYVFVNIDPELATLESTRDAIVQAVNEHPVVSLQVIAQADTENTSQINFDVKYNWNVSTASIDSSIAFNAISGAEGDGFYFYFNNDLSSSTESALRMLFNNNTPFANKVNVDCDENDGECWVQILEDVDLNDSNGLYTLHIPANILFDENGVPNNDALSFQIQDANSTPQLVNTRVTLSGIQDANGLNQGDRIYFEFSEPMDIPSTRQALLESLTTTGQLSNVTLVDSEPAITGNDFQVSENQQIFHIVLGAGDHLDIVNTNITSVELAAIGAAKDQYQLNSVAAATRPSLLVADMDIVTQPRIIDAYVYVNAAVFGDHRLVTGDYLIIEFSEAMDFDSTAAAIVNALSDASFEAIFTNDSELALNVDDIETEDNAFYVILRGEMALATDTDFISPALSGALDLKNNAIAADNSIRIALENFDATPGTRIELSRVYAEADFNQCDMSLQSARYNSTSIYFEFNELVTYPSMRTAILDWWTRMVAEGKAVDSIAGHSIDNIEVEGRKAWLTLQAGASLDLSQDLVVQLDPSLVEAQNAVYKGSTAEQLSATLAKEKGFEISIYTQLNSIKGDKKLSGGDSLSINFSCPLTLEASSQVWTWFFDDFKPRSTGLIEMYEYIEGNGANALSEGFNISINAGSEVDLSEPLLINLQNVETYFGDVVSAQGVLNADKYQFDVQFNFSAIDGRHAIFTSSQPVPSGVWYLKSSNLPIFNNSLEAVFSGSEINDEEQFFD